MPYSERLTGPISALLAQAAELAIRERTECISLPLLERAAGAEIFKLPVPEHTEEA